ncbi:hypothetical protein GIB67_009779 [Kingdonia uniflora]|uniref:Uncharacterized protein n=1 Tax=Kingdonia uniflora TaxID=39325 RepID=A0A7J7LXB2_9MAGN|nr:hypothetical protein GIB67_009779 [Kingdonia uniflora]
MQVNAFFNVRVVCASRRSKYFLTSMKSLQAPNSEPVSMSYSEYNDYPETSVNLREEVPGISNEVKAQEVSTFVNNVHTGASSKWASGDCLSCRPIVPWINVDGTMNLVVYEGLTRRVLGIVMQNPGILEDHLIHRMTVLNPQSCRTLLELMILDNHLILRRMHQTTSTSLPAGLECLFRRSFKKSESICRKHIFANPMSTFLL